MGFASMPDIAAYWSDTFLIEAPLRGVMNRNRFQYIKSALHFAETRETPAGSQPYYKVERLLERVRERCRIVFGSDRNVSTNEAVFKVESKRSPKSVIYFKLPKPIGEGIVLELVYCTGADGALTSGYVGDFEIRVKDTIFADHQHRIIMCSAGRFGTEGEGRARVCIRSSAALLPPFFGVPLISRALPHRRSLTTRCQRAASTTFMPGDCSSRRARRGRGSGPSRCSFLRWMTHAATPTCWPSVSSRRGSRASSGCPPDPS
jgi:hypothetical protein